MFRLAQAIMIACVAALGTPLRGEGGAAPFYPPPLRAAGHAREVSAGLQRRTARTQGVAAGRSDGTERLAAGGGAPRPVRSTPGEHVRLAIVAHAPQCGARS